MPDSFPIRQPLNTYSYNIYSTTMCRSIFDVRVPVQTVVNILNAVDRDKDGCVSIGEIIAFLKALAKSVRKTQKIDSKEADE